MNNLADAYSDEGKYAQAEALYSQILEIRRRVLGPEHPGTLSSMNYLAKDYTYEGKYAQAERIFSQTLEIDRRVLGPESTTETLDGLSANGGPCTSQLQGKYGTWRRDICRAGPGRATAHLGPRPPGHDGGGGGLGIGLPVAG